MEKWERLRKNPRFSHFTISLFRYFAVLSLFCYFAVFLFPFFALAADGWKEAEEPRRWSFPKDHGAHPEYRTEWWYFTGNLADEKGNRYGYQLTFFRQGIRTEPADRGNPWSVRDLYLAHFSISDVSQKRFTYDERVSRTGPGLAGASTEGLHVRLLDWSATQKGETISLRATNPSMEIVLELTPRKSVVLHGDQGLSRKGDREGQASYYTSYTDLATTGMLKPAGSAALLKVAGVSWFDHEFGSNQLTPEQEGWDWFSLHLSNGQELMLYLMRRTNGTVEPSSSGTLVGPEGKSTHIPLAGMNLQVLEQWKSPGSGAVYPSRWRISIPSAGIELTVSPLLADQELRTEASTGITYWEGAVDGQGLSRGRKVTCQGYVELTGYAGSMGGLF
jgi:predicted secreted hydrolase